MPWEEAKKALSPSAAIFGAQTLALGLSRQRTGGGGER
jgi:hypothetical protein